ncbi:hypothetical protein LCGC14_1044030, partial [marine sediment metagenome]
PVDIKTINAVSAARATIGANIKIVELETPLIMLGNWDGQRATGRVDGADELIDQVRKYNFDALAIATHITIAKDVALKYLKHGGVNPWGGVEAVLSKKVSKDLDRPVAHSPFGDTIEDFDEIVDPRMAAELVSRCYLHCVLKGLHRAPRIAKRLSSESLHVEDVDCLITPAGLCGPPHLACMERGIPIIIVTENTTCFTGEIKYQHNIHVRTYLEAAGIISCMRAGIDWRTTRRPLGPTTVYHRKS